MVWMLEPGGLREQHLCSHKGNLFLLVLFLLLFALTHKMGTSTLWKKGGLGKIASVSFSVPFPGWEESHCMWKSGSSGFSVSQWPVLPMCSSSACPYHELSGAALLLGERPGIPVGKVGSGQRSRQVLQGSIIGNRADHGCCVDLRLSSQKVQYL